MKLNLTRAHTWRLANEETDPVKKRKLQAVLAEATGIEENLVAGFRYMTEQVVAPPFPLQAPGPVEQPPPPPPPVTDSRALEAAAKALDAAAEPVAPKGIRKQEVRRMKELKAAFPDLSDDFWEENSRKLAKYRTGKEGMAWGKAMVVMLTEEGL